MVNSNAKRSKKRQANPPLREGKPRNNRKKTSRVESVPFRFDQYPRQISNYTRPRGTPSGSLVLESGTLASSLQPGDKVWFGPVNPTFMAKQTQAENKLLLDCQRFQQCRPTGVSIVYSGPGTTMLAGTVCLFYWPTNRETILSGISGLQQVMALPNNLRCIGPAWSRLTLYFVPKVIGRKSIETQLSEPITDNSLVPARSAVLDTMCAGWFGLMIVTPIATSAPRGGNPYTFYVDNSYWNWSSPVVEQHVTGVEYVTDDSIKNDKTYLTTKALTGIQGIASLVEDNALLIDGQIPSVGTLTHITPNSKVGLIERNGEFPVIKLDPPINLTRWTQGGGSGDPNFYYWDGKWYSQSSNTLSVTHVQKASFKTGVSGTVTATSITAKPAYLFYIYSEYYKKFCMVGVDYSLAPVGGVPQQYWTMESTSGEASVVAGDAIHPSTPKSSLFTPIRSARVKLATLNSSPKRTTTKRGSTWVTQQPTTSDEQFEVIPNISGFN